MAKETSIGELLIKLKVKTDALESGLNVAKKKIQEIEEENKKLEKSNSNSGASFIALAGTAAAAFAAIKSSISDAIDEYKSYTQAMESLNDVSEYTGQQLDDMSSIMQKYSSIMNKSDIATTIKNFSLMGFTAKQTDQMIQALTNSAIRNRNANYTVSEAVRVASEGYRQGLSTLSDSAGVTENLSVMLDNYAKSIGKTASKLTEAEKNQAYLNRTMYAAEPFAGAMEGYLDSLAGKQGLYAQTMRDTQVAYAEALQPTYSAMLTLGTSLLENITNLISANPNLTAGFTTFALTLSALVLVFVAVKKAIDIYSTSTFAATVATKGFTAALMENPLGLIAVAISAVIGLMVSLSSKIKEQSAAQAELNEKTDRYNQILNGTYGYTDEAINKVQEDKAKIDDEIENLNNYIDIWERYNELKSATANFNGIFKPNTYTLSDGSVLDDKEYRKQYSEACTAWDDIKKKAKNYGTTLDEVKDKLGELTEQQSVYQKQLDKANTINSITKAIDTNSLKTKQQEASQLKQNSALMQSYLKIVKTADKESTDYKKAVEALTEAYPEAASAGGILIDVAQGLIDAESLEADAAWKSAQDQINSQMSIIQAALASEDVQKKVAENLGISVDELNSKLTTTLALYQTMANYNPEDVPGVKPTILEDKASGSTTGSGSYSNEALDNYKRQIEHKKALDQLTLKEEIQMYEIALREYANTADEKMEIREKIYALNKELAQKERDILSEQTEDYEAYIQKQKELRGAAYDVVEQKSDYDKIISMHKNYLAQIMKDERLSLEERKQIYREELETIRDYEKQKRDLRVEHIDNTVTQLTNAITKQLEELQKKDKEAIDKNLEELENWKKARIDAINEEYDARIEAINKELEALNKAEEQKSRAEEDAEYEKKKLRLEQLIAYEHDETTKANYQKELNKLMTEYQKTLDERALQDKKDALNEQKNLLKEEQDNMTQAIEDEAEKKKEIYSKELEELEKYYSEQIDQAQDTAEKMLLNTKQNQDKILELLKSYGNAYEITGQTLGEKLAQGINEGVASKIENIIQKIQDTIDSNLELKIKEWTGSSYQYEEGKNKPVQNITINQTNNIEQMIEMPSETYRKLNNVSQNLASELAEVM